MGIGGASWGVVVWYGIVVVVGEGRGEVGVGKGGRGFGVSDLEDQSICRRVLQNSTNLHAVRKDCHMM